MIDFQERLAENEGKLKVIQSRLQQLEQNKQEALCELLRLDGEHRLLLQLEQESQNAR